MRQSTSRFWSLGCAGARRNHFMESLFHQVSSCEAERIQFGRSGRLLAAIGPMHEPSEIVVYTGSIADTY
jgi:hypothetical protein